MKIYTTVLMLFSLFFLNSQSLQDARNDVFCEIGQLDSAAEISTLVESLGDSFTSIDKKYKVHNGIDLSTSIGKTVHAAADGTVINIQYSKKGYGKNITIQHAYGYTTRYAHMALILVLKEGQKVKLGEPIGMVGSTGKSTGNHLHYEVKKEGVFLNPIGFFGLYSIISNSKINFK